MSLGVGVISHSSCVNYKCCKTKQFLHYICIKCYNVYHKSCIPKYRTTIRHLKQNRIICCQDESLSEYDEERSILEKTINELTEEGGIKNKYIEQLKKENKVFLEEVTQREEECNAIIKKQEEIIKELKDHIRKLEKLIMDRKKTSTISTQTIIDNKKLSTSSTQTKKSYKTVSTETETIAQEPYENIIKCGPDPSCSHVSQNDLLNNTSSAVSAKQNHIYSQSNKSISKILVISDDYGRNINKLVYSKLDRKRYIVQSIIKPGAHFNQVVENLEALTLNYTLEDHVIVIAGSNNFNKSHRYPLFRDICNKIKNVRNTNITFTTVPFRWHGKNHFIDKFNKKLIDFIQRIDRYVPSKVSIIDVNNSFRQNLTKSELARKITDIILNKNANINKTLVFINTNGTNINNNHNVNKDRNTVNIINSEILHYDNVNVQFSNISKVNNLSSTIEILDTTNDNLECNANNFLYPRLSQIFLSP